MKSIRLFFALVLLCFLFPAKAETTNKTSKLIDGLLSVSKEQCSEMSAAIKDFQQQGKQMTAEAMQDAMYNMCECMPQELQKLRGSMSAFELNTKITGSQLSKKILAPISIQCGASQLRRTYTLGCENRSFTKNKKNPSEYCSCMSRNLNQMSDKEIMEASGEMNDHAKRAEHAKKNGLPAPVQSLVVRNFYSMEAACSGE